MGKKTNKYIIAGTVSISIVIWMSLIGSSNAAISDFVTEMMNTIEVEEPIDEDSLRFPIYDKKYLGTNEEKVPSIDLKDPPNLQDHVEYNPDENVFYLDQKLKDLDNRTPSYMGYDDYAKQKFQQDQNDYFQQRLEALSMFNKKPTLPELSKEGLFDRLFGSNKIKIEPQGSIEIIANGFWENRKNYLLAENMRKYFAPEFNMNMNVNLVAQIGDKLKLNIANNTNPTMLNQNRQNIEFTGKEDEILKKIELGNVSFPLKSNLVAGVESLFGIKTQLQFGRLWITAALSQQKSQRRSLTIQGGGQNQPFEFKADNYEENKNFLLSQYFYNNYDKALENFPIINSQVQINKIEVWITNRTGVVNGVRDVMAFMDLGEKNPYVTSLSNPSGSNLPDNRSNTLYDQLQSKPSSRAQSTANTTAMSFGLTEGQDFQRVTMRVLNSNEYSFNPQLGFISLKSTVNSDDVLAVSYRYTYNGNVYQVGEFSDEMPPDSTSQKVIFSKLIKGISNRPLLPIWNLMMKNVYSVGYGNIAKEDFRLDVFYQDPGGGEKRYLPEGNKEGVPLLRLLNLDRLNYQNDPIPDGVFDFVEGVTILPNDGKIIFPVLQPFGENFKAYFDGNPALERKYLYNILYDSTKVIAQQRQQNNRYVIKGTYRSSMGSDIFLGGFSIPEGSVSVNAGGMKLSEGSDYSVDYASGRLKILNPGIMNSGVPINVTFEDNAAFGTLQQNFTGIRADYFVNDKLTVGATYMKLAERPFGYKTRYGEDPIKNQIYSADVAYQTEVPKLTKLLDKLPYYSTSAPSFISTSLEGAAIIPGHHKFVDIAGDEGGTNFLDDFEGSAGSIDLKFPAYNWSLSSVPSGAIGPGGNILFPEASLVNDLRSGINRANLSWYTLEPNLVSGNNVPQSIKEDFKNMHYMREVSQTDVFRNKTAIAGQDRLTTLDLAFFPRERGPYNFDVNGIDPATGNLNNPRARWGGIQRSIDNMNSDFETSNVEYITFWMMDPFIENTTSNGGYLYFNLGNVSEDVLKDGRMAFENGIDYPKDETKLDKTNYGYIPKFQQQITRAFLNDPASRSTQDVGYDLLDDEEEKEFYKTFLDQISAVLPSGSSALQRLLNDPANDNYKYFRHTDYDNENASVFERYKKFNRPQGNSAISDNDFNNTPGTQYPESEDLNRDNTLNESEAYYQYKIRLQPGMNVGDNYIVDKHSVDVKLKDGSTAPETWYQFKIPIRDYDEAIGGIGDFRSIRFIRMFLNDFEDSVFVRFGQLQLDRNNWRRYQFSLINPGENIPEDDVNTTSYALTTVSVEQNGNKKPVGYVMPPGIVRQQQPVTSGQMYQQDEQSIALQVCGLKDGDARAIFKDFGRLDLRQYEKLRMFIHAESVPNQQILKNGDVQAFIRIGSDFTNNYYEYELPLEITPDNANNPDIVWPEKNRMVVDLKKLVEIKNTRNEEGRPSHIPYSYIDEYGNNMTIIGNPNLADANNIMIGVKNPKKTSMTPDDDGLRKCVEVWFNELRVSGMNEEVAYAAAANMAIQLADLGNVNVAGSMRTPGYGNINQKLNERNRDNFYQFSGNTNLNLGKLMPTQWGVNLPIYLAYSENVSTPQYSPYDKDVLLSDVVNQDINGVKLKEAAQNFNSFTSFNINNLRIQGNNEKLNPNKIVMPWSIKNFDLNYNYNKTFKRTPLVESDIYTDQKFALNYVYKLKPKTIEPFKNLFKDRNVYWNLIKDFNINILPTNFTFRNQLHRTFGETIIRNIDGDPYELPNLYVQNFTWERTYNLNWELTKSLSVNYAATNNSRIDEPYGRIDSQEDRDSLWRNIKDFGRNTYYTHDIRTTYAVPFRKIPALDWVNVTGTYNAQYFWTASSILAASQGNTISNNATKQVNGSLNFTQLYNKSRYLKNLNRVTNNSSVINKDKKDNKDAKDNNNITRPSSSLPPRPKKIIYTRDSIPGHDTLSRSVVYALLREKKRGERIRFNKELENWKRKRNAIVPDMNDGTKVGLRLLTMVKNVNFSLTETEGTVLPGYMDTATFLGMNTRNWALGGFVIGAQPTTSWLESEAAARRITQDSIFNGQFQQQYSRNININAGLEPLPDLRIDLNYNSNFRKNYTEIFKYDRNESDYVHYNPYDMGSFSMSFIGLKTMFQPLSATKMSESFNNMLEYRKVISERLGILNPYTNGLKDPLDPEYYKGYGRYSQDVVIPAFIAAYTGRDPKTSPIFVYENRTSQNNPFRNIKALPNWSIRYTGLNKLESLKDKVKALTISHTYRGNMAMNSFNSQLFYQDFIGVGFPSFIDSVSGNYVPYFLVPNLTIDENFSPLIGVDMQLNNSLTLKVMFNKSRQLSLSLLDYQVSETKSTDLVIGAGFRSKGLTLPFSLFGIKRLDNDVNFKLDIGLRDDITVNSYMATRTVTATRGQMVITIAPSIDYIVNDNLQIRLFFDRKQTVPYVSQSFPITTTRGGLVIRYIFSDAIGF